MENAELAKWRLQSRQNGGCSVGKMEDAEWSIWKVPCGPDVGCCVDEREVSCGKMEGAVQIIWCIDINIAKINWF